MVNLPSVMNATPTCTLAVILTSFVSPAWADGLQDLVRPNLDVIRENAKEERIEEAKRQERLREEEMARRLEEERKLAELEAARADPLVDVDGLELASDESGKDFYIIGSGDRLGPIAAERYGSSQYHPIIEYWNDIKATKIFVGQKIQTPSLATIMKVKGERVLSRYPDEVTAMLELRQDYVALAEELYALEEGEVSAAHKETLGLLYESAKEIHAGFLVKRPGVTNYATGLLAQCKNVMDQLDAMRSGDLGSKKSRVTRVHTALAYAMLNAMIWGAEDFK